VKAIIYRENEKVKVKFILNLRTNSNVETIQFILDRKKYFECTVSPLKAFSSLFKTYVV